MLREALRELLEQSALAPHANAAMASLDATMLVWAQDRAKAVLRMETGRHAEQEWTIMGNLVYHAYTLADWVWMQQYGVPRSLAGCVPDRAEVLEALQAIATLTQAARDLDALLDAPPAE